MINKVGGTIDRVNVQLDKVDLMTDSAVDAVDSVDTAIRAVSFAIQRPVHEGLRPRGRASAHGFADFRVHRDCRAAPSTAAKAAARRREEELAEELRDARPHGT